jgi:hypothetical protein
MSGPKCARVRPTPVSRVAAALVEVERAVLACTSRADGGLADFLNDTARWLTSLRHEAAELQRHGLTPRSPQESASLQRLERLREDLSLAIANEQSKCSALAKAQGAAKLASDTARESLARGGSTAAQLSSIESGLRKAAAVVDDSRKVAEQAMRRIARQRAELEAYHKLSVKDTAAAQDADRGGDDPGNSAKAAADEAARMELRRQSAKLAQAPEGGWEELEKWAGPGRPSDGLRAMLRSADELVARGDIAAASTCLECVASRREEIERGAEANRAAAGRLRSVADAVMQALCDRHYNMPRFGEMQEGDPMSGIRIRADVPSADGCGNIRIDLHADGRANFEVENVPTGEEEVCRTIIGGLAEAVATEGLELEVTDWGRAAGVEPKEIPTLQKPEKIQERQRGGTIGRSDAPGGRL